MGVVALRVPEFCGGVGLAQTLHCSGDPSSGLSVYLSCVDVSL